MPQPTLEQIRDRSAAAATSPRERSSCLRKSHRSWAALAAHVTAESTNDYDALVALQAWFRGPEFSYSLDAPVEDGFDGSGAEAVAQFLEKREGYCIHFASAFALMARTLGMPSRIVEGYLPGIATSDAVERETVYSVSSDQRHALAGSAFRGNRLGFLRADERPRSSDFVLARVRPGSDRRRHPGHAGAERLFVGRPRSIARRARRRSAWRRSPSHLRRGQPAASAHPDPRRPVRLGDPRPHPGVEAVGGCWLLPGAVTPGRRG